ncbi:MAG: hypothetical protein GTN38_00950 [Candidatus Aenigmarchaeota archaeon]|nr:hypothetical protein [Candidatus Aenigmarchaeota archaeon]NIP40155.1 hypothetical protein [Candidatus Aenigmarchaeota archaeon]NIQ17199.1 hypothetical protein [Candidatus Aenigmarchaeota archaeon]NIS72989.1 hypothetical protein [Candidatus Aenigmarchaeota archaeon]
MKRLWAALIVAIAFLALYAFNFINAYWLGMLGVIFIALGLIMTFMLAGAGATKTEGANMVGLVLLLVGIILILIIFLFPK